MGECLGITWQYPTNGNYTVCKDLFDDNVLIIFTGSKEYIASLQSTANLQLTASLQSTANLQLTASLQSTASLYPGHIL